MTYLRKFCFILVVFFSHQSFAEEGRILFLSHPKSGTRWGLYCICTLTDRNLDFRLGDRKYNLLRGAIKDKPNGFIYAGHTPMSFEEIDDTCDKLILIVRNYRESLLSWGGSFQRAIQNIAQEEKSCTMDKDRSEVFSHRRWGYFNNLLCYELWNPIKRLLIYYEDLVTDPERVLGEVVDFLEIDHVGEVLEQFLENFDFHQDYCLNEAFRGGKKEESKNKDLLMHSKRIGMPQSKEMDLKVQQSFPYLFETYLKRYEILGNSF